MSPAAAKSAFSRWVPVEVYPIFAVVGGAVAGAGFYLYRLSQGTEVVWNRHGDWRPWDTVKQDQNIKFMTVHPDWWAARKAEVAAKAAASQE